MGKIDCKLFGFPTVVENGRDVFLPIGKISGLFYYILLKKVVSRDELAGIFWPNSGEEQAQVSLRNAIHKIRHSFQEQIFLSPNKKTLLLNDSIQFFIDIEEFNKDPLNNLNLYKGEFLEGFFIRGALLFEQWMNELRIYYREKYIFSLQENIELSFETKDYQDLENKINALIIADNYNEMSYLYLMKYYQLRERPDKIINEYYTLQKLMVNELGIQPSEEIKQLYTEAVRLVNHSQQYMEKNNLFRFYNRDYELETLQKNVDNFYCEDMASSMLIVGETGIGKTVLKRKLLENNKGKFKIFETQCYSIEKEFSYSPWMKIIKDIDQELHKKNLKTPYLWDDVLKKFFYDLSKNNHPKVQIMENVENFNMDLIYSSLHGAFKLLSANQKVLFVLEDIQWADQFSIKLLINLILHADKNILFLLTKSGERDEKTDWHLSTLEELNKLIIVELKRFSKKDVGIIIQQSLRDKNVPHEVINYIYEKSKGNAFFLKEYIELYKNNKLEQSISLKMQSILQDKFSNISENEMILLNIISLLYGEVDIDSLLKIVKLTSFDVIKSINNLVKINVLEEKQHHGQIKISFVHSAYKDYISEALNATTKQILHQEIAKIFEEELINDNQDISNYIRLKHHYTCANDAIKSLKYEVYILNYYLNFNHELFPNLDDYDLSKQVKLYMKNDKALSWIDSINKEILIIKNKNCSKYNIQEIQQIEQLFLYCKGRYLIRCGNYSEGIKVMSRVIQLSVDFNDLKMELLGHKQMIVYGIQINNTQIMLNHIILGIKVARKLSSTIEMGILYRLYGLYHLMKGDFITAESLFNESIELFSTFDGIGNSNSISIAADYNYIGEIRNANGEYIEAMTFFEKAIELCRTTEPSCLSFFYINAGKTCYLMGNLEEMKRYFLLAENIVKRFDSYWKNSVLDAFLSLSYYLEQNFSLSFKYLKNAIAEVKTINNPRDIGIVYFVETILKSIIENQQLTKNEIADFLNEPAELYYYQALKYLDPNRDRAEVEFLKSKI